MNTPGGTPASCRISANRIALNGAISLGLSTIVQPAASAGATFAHDLLIGQFHGVISAHTPIGSCDTSSESVCVLKRNDCNARIVCSRCAVPTAACIARANAIGAPISWLIVRATSS